MQCCLLSGYITHPTAVTICYGLYAFGWGLLLVATCMINHFDLFGLRQVWMYFRGQTYRRLPFSTPWLYGVVRHPIYIGWIIAFWATPTMTVTHLAFAVISTAYILVAIQFEERDLLKSLPGYATYRNTIPMLIPGWAGMGGAGKSPTAASE